MDSALLSLFISALISATLLPGGSEALLVYWLMQESHAPYLLVFSATLGNVLGSLITYAMGLLLNHYYPLKLLQGKSHQRARDWIERYGAWALLLAWLPIVGDPLCFVAGWLRVSPVWSFLAISLGKTLRYSLIAFWWL
ncbi:YqaA family protein [Nitrincola tapanii]|uniref:DedA family protein n=1 Tax=Nitrincola tapanii TaxID=1708751 RepID=A0A5A9W330_9GAMM|nr:YqaA family protein [Nitrincola tapanii]KAA0873961.1 DedA family protein [Nitrincola tapanii]